VRQGRPDRVLADGLASGSGEACFRHVIDCHRRELQVHCYRILGSIKDAEDQVQETFLAAWRGTGGFEVRASGRACLFRIASNRCLGRAAGGAGARLRWPDGHEFTEMR
jgi:DNA-directed RNA polymerase specialized sigma24 family protein